MHIIAGLGNPGRGYKNTRHNIGFMVIDRLASLHNITVNKRKFRAKAGGGEIAGESVCLIKPQTYMNLSGISIGAALGFYRIPPERLIVICDDTALDTGRLRIREKGSAGGHNGLKDIIAELGSDGFIRVRVGIGSRPEYMDQKDYVLSKFAPEETQIIEAAVIRAADAVTEIIKNGTAKAMNEYNGIIQ